MLGLSVRWPGSWRAMAPARRAACALLALQLLLSEALLGASAVSFHLPPNQRKCLREEVQKDDLIKGDFELSVTSPDIKTDIEILDSRGHKLFNKQDAQKGKFAFSVEEYEIIEMCFETKFDVPYGRPAPPPREITFNILHGVEAKNYDDLAKAEKLKPMEAELRRLEDLSDAIVESFNHMRKREEEMRGTNEQTSSKILYFSVFSMVCLLSLTTWQVMYLRRFFKAKKLIE
ncbi:transmembrane emp24 domain-containing protein 10-like [Paramacrobiotus metropolitanus]|uniref:transmembrane emp24 domain-containing protein 10-like n=1 Tax=Paramacrobiotus metropolitanus TaxID=2943436 RepID=UPI002445EC43|nr:transmembrane emp24 domain-containing protein 10-like [Paramacrobiotus metropolitanus]